MNRPSAYSLAICFAVWNRGDLFQASFASLLRQLAGVEAAIWIFDNGSDLPTRRVIEGLTSSEHRIFKVFLPQNMGIPFVVNIFAQLLTQDCECAGYRAPGLVMVADADAYFKKPIRDMIEILSSNTHYAIISGHDSVEHESIVQYQYKIRGEEIVVKEKEVERGLCLLMRKEILSACIPFPHHRTSGVNWELMKRHPNSLSARMRKLIAVDYVAHLGLYDNACDPVGVPSNQAQTVEINRVLEQESLLLPERRARMEAYCRSFQFGATAVEADVEAPRQAPANGAGEVGALPRSRREFDQALSRQAREFAAERQRLQDQISYLKQVVASIYRSPIWRIRNRIDGFLRTIHLRRRPKAPWEE
jgi:Glycosyl transferase family 2